MRVLFIENWPNYFQQQEGRRTIRRLVDFLTSMAEDGRNRYPEDGFRKRFVPGRAESDGFIRLMNDPEVSLHCRVLEPNFTRYYWSPDNRGKVAGLAIAFRKKDTAIAFRVVYVHLDGRVRKVSDYGLTDYAFMPCNVKYHNIAELRDQFVLDDSAALMLPDA